jgi:hypothetical protein
MAEFDFSGSFINADNVKENDILTIVGMPVAEEKESAQQKVIDNGVLKAKKYKVLNIPVELNANAKTYTPDNKTGMRFVDAWGRDYTKWNGKQFKVKIEKYTAFGSEKTRVAGFPLIAEVVTKK